MDYRNKDRRIFSRLSADFPIKFAGSSEAYGSRISLKDISAEGLRFFSNEKTDIKGPVNLLVNVPDGKNPLALNGIVVWTRKDASGASQVGIKFSKVNFMKMHRIVKFCS